MARVSVIDPPDVVLDPGVKQYLGNAIGQVSRELDERTPDDVARSRVLIQSPNGKVWALYVDDAGVVKTTPVTRPSAREGAVVRSARSW
jgi:hypothetical protein